MRPKLAVVILAGGEGSRIGGYKPLRTLGGERLIDRAIREAREWSDLVAVAVRDPVQVQPVDVMVLADDADVEGPLGGLVVALNFGRECGTEFVLTIPADMPFLPPDLPDRLINAVGHSGCALASSGGHLHPVCGLWRTTALKQLDLYLESNKRSLKGLAEQIGFRSVQWPAEPLDPFFNINSADDLSRAGRLL